MDVKYEPEFERIVIDGYPFSFHALKMIVDFPDGKIFQIQKMDGNIWLTEVNAETRTSSGAMQTWVVGESPDSP